VVLVWNETKDIKKSRIEKYPSQWCGRQKAHNASNGVGGDVPLETNAANCLVIQDNHLPLSSIPML